MKACRWWLGFVCVVVGGLSPASAQTGTGAIEGTVIDPLGAGIESTIMLLRDGEAVARTGSDATGAFRFGMIEPGRYRVQADADGFSTAVSDLVFVGGSALVRLTLTLHIGPLEQYVVVTATAAELPQSLVGSPVTVITQGRLEELAKPDVFEAVRHVPGAQVLQTGQRGGTTAIFVRGGAANFNKVLIDGVPANDIGGAFDFGTLATTGVDTVEVLRTANSVQYGPDALSGVISVTTRRGAAGRPEVTYSIDGGNLGTIRQEVSLGGVVDRFDYFVAGSRFDTDNDLPNNDFRNDTIGGQFGVTLGGNTDLSMTFRRVDTGQGTPGPVLFTGLANNSSIDSELWFVGVTARSQLGDRWRTTVRFASTDLTSNFRDPSPTGEPFDPFGFGANFLGQPVTIAGANGFSVSGRAIVDFGSVLYPSVFDSETARRSIAGQLDYTLSDTVDLSGGVRVEHEDGSQDAGFGVSSTERTNAGAFVEGRVNLLNRVHLTVGTGFEDNEAFGVEVTPRLSAAVYLRPPAPTGAAFGDTKLTFNIGRGIKAPTVFDELNSIFTVLESLPEGAELIAQAGVEQIGPEQSRSIDVGVEQGLWSGRARARVAYFHNIFSDLIEFVQNSTLPGLGVPPEIAFALPFGARVNAASHRARGIETSAEVVVADGLDVAATYMFLDATVTESFSSGALTPIFNPAFPGIAIGQFGPLVGGRPFRRPTHSGSVLVRYTEGPAQVALSAAFVGKSDDSTFLSDPFFGPSLLLPNKDLTDGYQKLDLSGSYRVHRRVRWYAVVENLLDQDYTAAVGFPSLPVTFRTGFSLTVGG